MQILLAASIRRSGLESKRSSQPNYRKDKKGTQSDVEVVLLHEKEQTLQVLPEIIAFFKEKGYEYAVYNDEKHFSLNFLNDTRF